MRYMHGGVLRCTEVCRGLQRCMEGCVEVHGDVLRCMEGCMEVHRGV